MSTANWSRFLSTVQHLQPIIRLNFCVLVKCTSIFGNMTIDPHRYMYNCIFFRYKVWMQNTRNETFIHMLDPSQNLNWMRVYTTLLCVPFVWSSSLRILLLYILNICAFFFPLGGQGGVFFRFLMLCLNLYFSFHHTRPVQLCLSVSDLVSVYFVGRLAC